MNIEKTNEQYRVTDTCEYNDIVYQITGTMNKSLSEKRVYLNIEDLGTVQYSKSNERTYFDFNLNTNAEISEEMFMNAMYSKIREIIEFND